MRAALFISIAVFAVTLPLNGFAGDYGKETAMTANSADREVIPLEELEITVIYDNRPYRQGLECAWGFSCLIRVTGKTILFDTGGDGDILMGNMEKSGIDPGIIDQVVISHAHWDHTGGMQAFLQLNPGPEVYILSAFPDEISRAVEKSGGSCIEADKSASLCSGAKTTGKMGEAIKEQSLIVETSEGVVVITGCAHPGIVNIVKRAADISDDDILLVMGGFHLLDKTNTQLQGIISELREMGVRFTAPCHCSGEEAIDAFEEAYRDYFIRIGTGRVITARDFM